MNNWTDSLIDSELPSQGKVKRPGSPNGSHAVALTQASAKDRKSQRVNVQSTEIAFTVRIKNKSLTRKHLRLILDVLLYEIVDRGITLAKLMLLTHLYQQILGTKLSPLDLHIDHERRVILLTEIIIKDVSDKTFDHFLSTEVLTDTLRQEILDNNLIMSKRTYFSRKGHWMPEDWLEIRPVGLDLLIERNGNSERYTGYCKGYGESHPSAHYKKTRPSAELDGEDASEPQPIRLTELRQLIILNKLNLKPKSQRRKD